MYATKLDKANKFYAIHSKDGGHAIGRVVLKCSDDHMLQLQNNNEGDVWVGSNTEADQLAKDFEEVCRKAAEGLNLPLGQIEETEFIKAEPNAPGQDAHMDAPWGSWNFFTPLGPSPGTTIKKQEYQEYPMSMGPYSCVPKNWKDLPNLHIEWSVGDLLMMRSNAIHGGPPNGPERRYVLFSAEKSATVVDEYSDTAVIFERDFFIEKQLYSQRKRDKLRSMILRKHRGSQGTTSSLMHTHKQHRHLYNACPVCKVSLCVAH